MDQPKNEEDGKETKKMANNEEYDNEKEEEKPMQENSSYQDKVKKDSFYEHQPPYHNREYNQMQNSNNMSQMSNGSHMNSRSIPPIGQNPHMRMNHEMRPPNMRGNFNNGQPPQPEFRNRPGPGAPPYCFPNNQYFYYGYDPVMQYNAMNMYPGPPPMYENMQYPEHQQRPVNNMIGQMQYNPHMRNDMQQPSRQMYGQNPHAGGMYQHQPHNVGQGSPSNMNRSYESEMQSKREMKHPSQYQSPERGGINNAAPDNAFDIKNLNAPNAYEPVQMPVLKAKKRVVTSSSSCSNESDCSSSEDVSTCSSSSQKQTAQPKKRGRPRKSVQPTPFQRPQMPYNPGVNPPYGYYQPGYGPMSFKPTNPYNPALPRLFGQYNTKNSMRGAVGPMASSYNHVFNHPIYRQFSPGQHPYANAHTHAMPRVTAAPQPYAPLGPRNARTPTIGRPKKREREISSPIIKKKRKSAVTVNIRHTDDELEETEEEQDPYEKIIATREDDYFLVKFRNKSYLHCDWVHRDEITQTKGGLIKVKRFRPLDDGGIDPEFITVEKVLHTDYEETEEYGRKKIYLIKWKKKCQYEQSTFEYEDKVKSCVGFEEAFERYQKRLVMRNQPNLLEWRPPRETYIPYNKLVGFKNNNELRSYQLEGLNWLMKNWLFRQGCIMADEMGLGKTVQSVTFINTLFQRYNIGPVLIVTPLTTMPHWEREFEAWTDLRVAKFHGSAAGREVIHTYEMGTNSKLLFDVLITTYEMVIAGVKHLEEFRFSVGIYDEAHRLKNTESKALQALNSIYFNHKVLLSGTPLQNDISELWSLLNFIDPLKFSNLNFFLEEYKITNHSDVERLQSIIKPILLRRMKSDVEKSIPVKEETIIEVELTMIQKRFYRALLEKNIHFLTGSDRSVSYSNIMMELRKCCIHPYLICGAEEQIIQEHIAKQTYKELGIADTSKNELAENAIEVKKSSGNFGYEDKEISDELSVIAPESETKKIPKKEAEIQAMHMNLFGLPYDDYYKIMIQSSGKLVLLDKLLTKIKDNHKVLIFSQMTRCLNLLAEYLTYKNYKYERIDGGVRGDQRQAAIDRFSDPENNVFVFLLCTRAGGVGINLTAADVVVIFDSDWNPQNDLQAQARCHRIGQKNEVKVYRLITRNSYEREMFDRASMKLGIDRAILQSMNYEGTGKKIDKNAAIELLLKKGAYGVLMETDDVAEKFCEEDIDSILERRTKTIKHEESGNMFSKTTFQVEEEIDDPDFWSNLLSKKKSEKDEEKIKKQMRRLARVQKINWDVVDLEIKRLEIEIEKFKEPKLYKRAIKEPETQEDNDGSATVPISDVATTKSGSNEDSEVASTDEALNYTRTLALLIFFTALKKGTHALTTLKNTKRLNKVFGYIIKYCYDLIEYKQKEDYALQLEHFLKDDYEQQIFEGIKFYREYCEALILRVQTVLILTYLTKKNDVTTIERSKGFTLEDDRRVINWVLVNGYDNFPSSTGSEKGAFKGKNSSLLNQRVRKIIMGLNKNPDEIELEHTDLSRECLISFGKVTDENKETVETWFDNRVKLVGYTKDFNEFIAEVLSTAKEVLSGKKKRGVSEVSLLQRVLLFDRLKNLDTIPIRKKTPGLPRKWNSENDSEMRDMVLSEGVTDDVAVKLGVSVDVLVKRIDVLIEKVNEKE